MLPSTEAQRATRWRAYDYAPWPTLFVDVARGEGVYTSGAPFTCRPGATLAELLAALPPDVRRVYLCRGAGSDLPTSTAGPIGPALAAESGEGEDRPDDPDGQGSWEAGEEDDDLDWDAPPSERQAQGFRAWCLDPRTLDGWEIGARGYYLGRAPHYAALILRFRHREIGREVHVQSMAAWFGGLPTPPAEARAAMCLLQQQIAQPGTHWEGAVLLGTPAETGRDLWRRGIPYGHEYPILPPDVRDLIAHTSGQGRAEIVHLPGAPVRDTIPGLAYLDGRFKYAASCRELGVGLLSHDSRPEYAGYQPSRYRVRFTVLPDWRHVGLLMVPRERVRDGWWYPAEPSYQGETWGSNEEIARTLYPFATWCPDCLAGYRALSGHAAPRLPAPCPEHGWRIVIRERLLFQSPHDRNARGPLDTWRDKLIALRQGLVDLGHTAEREGRPPREVHACHLAAAGARAILLNMLGSFARRTRPVLKLARRDDPGEAASIPYGRVEIAGDLVLWEEPAPLEAYSDPFAHPEWPAQVWARTRAHLLISKQVEGWAGALTRDPAEIVAFRTDCLALTADPGWPDDGKAGRLRLKGSLPGPLPAPRTLPDLDRLTRRITQAASPACCRHPAHHAELTQQTLESER